MIGTIKNSPGPRITWKRPLELDPLYVDVILRRYEAVTGRPAILESTGETYAELARRRQRDAKAHLVPLANEKAPNDITK